MSTPTTSTQPKAITEFEGHYVRDSKVIATWGEFMTRTDIAPVQKRLDDHIKELAKPAQPTATDEGYAWYNPIGWVVSIYNGIYSVIANAWNWCCGAKSDAPAEQPKTETTTPKG